MGVNGILTRVLPSVGETVALPNLSCFSTHNNSHQPCTRSRKKNIIVGLDVSTLIHNACYGQSHMLHDERQLSNYGRAQLVKERNKQDSNQQVQDCTYANNFRNEQYVLNCAALVMSKIQTLNDSISGEQAGNCKNILVVFDGKSPPMKKHECNARNSSRLKAILKRDELLVTKSKKGSTKDKHDHSENQRENEEDQHQKESIKAIHKAGPDSITFSRVVGALIKQLRQQQIPFLVAPYEADSQLAYLAKRNLIDLVVTEDSDMIAYGVKSILYKLQIPYDSFNRDELFNRHDIERLNCVTGIMIHRKNLGSCEDLDLLSFTDSMLVVLFITAGCDYCPNLIGIGIVTACKIVKEAFQPSSSASGSSPLQKVFSSVYSKTKIRNEITSEEKTLYEKQFLRALFAFHNAIVFNPSTEKFEFSSLYFSSHDEQRLREYPPYNSLCENDELKLQIVGTDYIINHTEKLCKTKTKLYVEGWVNIKNDEMYEDDNNSIPEHIVIDYESTFKRINNNIDSNTRTDHVSDSALDESARIEEFHDKNTTSTTSTTNKSIEMSLDYSSNISRIQQSSQSESTFSQNNSNGIGKEMIDLSVMQHKQNSQSSSDLSKETPIHLRNISQLQQSSGSDLTLSQKRSKGTDTMIDLSKVQHAKNSQSSSETPEHMRNISQLQQSSKSESTVSLECASLNKRVINEKIQIQEDENSINMTQNSNTTNGDKTNKSHASTNSAGFSSPELLPNNDDSFSAPKSKSNGSSDRLMVNIEHLSATSTFLSPHFSCSKNNSKSFHSPTLQSQSQDLTNTSSLSSTTQKATGLQPTPTYNSQSPILENLPSTSSSNTTQNEKESKSGKRRSLTEIARSLIPQRFFHSQSQENDKSIEAKDDSQEILHSQKPDDMIHEQSRKRRRGDSSDNENRSPQNKENNFTRNSFDEIMIDGVQQIF